MIITGYFSILDFEKQIFGIFFTITGCSQKLSPEVFFTVFLATT